MNAHSKPRSSTSRPHIQRDMKSSWLLELKGCFCDSAHTTVPTKHGSLSPLLYLPPYFTRTSSPLSAMNHAIHCQKRKSKEERMQQGLGKGNGLLKIKSRRLFPLVGNEKPRPHDDLHRNPATFGLRGGWTGHGKSWSRELDHSTAQNSGHKETVAQDSQCFCFTQMSSGHSSSLLL